MSTEFYEKLGTKVMKKELNYLASKRWEKVDRQELGSTPYKQEIHPWWNDGSNSQLCQAASQSSFDSRSIAKVPSAAAIIFLANKTYKQVVERWLSV
jgi:hypothetical protein